MKTQKIPVLIFSGLLAIALHGQAQTVFPVTFKGTVQTTNSNGDVVSQKLSTQTYLNDAATALGLSSTNGSGTNVTKTAKLSLVYVQNASTDPSASGDYIEVLEGTNNSPVYTNLLFLYGGSFPPALTNLSGTAYVAGAQVIPIPLAGTGDSLGGATINEKTMKNGKVMISGSFNYTSLRSPGSSANDTIRIFNGTFTVGKQISP
jgi:hypothetical protein